MARRPKRKDAKDEEAFDVPPYDKTSANGAQSSRRASVAFSASEPIEKRPRREFSPALHDADIVSVVGAEVLPSKQVNMRFASSDHALQPPKPTVKPLRLGDYSYYPIRSVEDNKDNKQRKATVSIFGMVCGDTHEPRSTRGGQDTIKVVLADASCVEGTGSAASVEYALSVVFFHFNHDHLPSGLKEGQIMALREIEVQTFNEQPQGVAKANNPKWSWSVYDHDTGTIKSSPNVNPDMPVSEEEMQHYQFMARKWLEVRTAGQSPPSALKTQRLTITLDQVKNRLFFDVVVDIVKIYYGVNPVLFVTDYCRNKEFPRHSDPELRLGKFSYPDRNGGHGHVFQISLFDSAATLGQGLQAGQTVRIRNVRGKHNQYGMLEGALGSVSDFGVEYQILNTDDPANAPLRERKAKLAGDIFEASRQAAAESIGRQSQHQPTLERTESRSSVSASRSTSKTNGMKQSSSPATECDDVKVNPVVASLAEAPNVISTPSSAQRALQSVQVTDARNSDSHAKTNAQSLVEDMLWLPRPVEARAAEPPRPLICCHAPSAVSVTSLLDLQTTAKCPDAHKISGRILSTEPRKVKDWARLLCRDCSRLLPLRERFCTKCGDEDGKSLLYCLRFILILQETEKEKQMRLDMAEDSLTQHGQDDTLTVEIVFHGESSEKLLPFVDVGKLYNGDLLSIKQLKRFRDQMLFPSLYNRQPETTFSVHSYPKVKSGRTVREFAAFKQEHVLHNSFDPDAK